MERKLTCIVCPRGCALTVSIEGEKVTVTGNTCPRGAVYGEAECTHPTRTVTSSARVANRTDTMVSVKTKEPVPKENIFDVMEKVHALKVDAPVNAGDVLIEDCFGTELIATATVK